MKTDGSFEGQLYSRQGVMRAPTRTAVKGLEKRECCPWTWSHCMGQWRCPPKVGTMGGRYSHCRTRETWGDGRAGAGAKPSLAEDVACWGTHETRSLTECALKTVFCAVPVPSLPSPASILASSTNTKPPRGNQRCHFRVFPSSLFFSGYISMKLNLEFTFEVYFLACLHSEGVFFKSEKT